MRLFITLLFSLFFLSLFVGESAEAQVLGPSVREVKFEFTTDFRTELKKFDNTNEVVISNAALLKDYRGVRTELPQNLPAWVSATLQALVEMHASHMFGVMVAPERIKSEGLFRNAAGFGSLRLPLKYEIIKFKEDPNNTPREDHTYVKYKVSGTILLQKEVAVRWLKMSHDLAAAKAHAQATGRPLSAEKEKALTVSFPFPYNWDKAYDKHCTDHHYYGLGDFWYFWNPYSRECRYLLKEPLTKNVALKITDVPPTFHKDPETPVGLAELRGNNGNGEVFEITVIHGFNEDAHDPNDEGKKAHDAFLKYIGPEGLGFETVISHSNTFKEHSIHEKRMQFRGVQGESLVRIESILVDTDITTRSVEFAKAFKRAVSNSDVIYYGGHSGLGANIDIPSLDAKLQSEGLTGLEFNRDKKQIFFFDSCSSYSYYLYPFRKEKTNKSIDVVSYGLASLFGQPETMENFMNYLLNPRIEDGKWLDLLKAMEKPLDGDSWLLSVGGI